MSQQSAIEPGVVKIEKLHTREETTHAIGAVLQKLQIGQTKVTVLFAPDVLAIIDGLLKTFEFLLVTCEQQPVRIDHELVLREYDNSTHVAISCTRRMN